MTTIVQHADLGLILLAAALLATAAAGSLHAVFQVLRRPDPLATSATGSTSVPPGRPDPDGSYPGDLAAGRRKGDGTAPHVRIIPMDLRRVQHRDRFERDEL